MSVRFGGQDVMGAIIFDTHRTTFGKVLPAGLNRFGVDALAGFVAASNASRERPLPDRVTTRPFFRHSFTRAKR